MTVRTALCADGVNHCDQLVLCNSGPCHVNADTREQMDISAAKQLIAIIII